MQIVKNTTILFDPFLLQNIYDYEDGIANHQKGPCAYKQM
mgnify:CR=1 FL=1